MFIQGQWWSNLSTHLLHIAQCLLLADLITLHSGHRSAGLISLRRSMNGCPENYLRAPGSLQLAYKNETKTIIVVTAFPSCVIWDVQCDRVGRMINMLTTWTIPKRNMKRVCVLWFRFNGMRGTLSIRHS